MWLAYGLKQYLLVLILNRKYDEMLSANLPLCDFFVNDVCDVC